MDLLFAMLMYTIYNGFRIAGTNPKMEHKGIEEFIPNWWTDDEVAEAGDVLRDKVAATFAAFGGSSDGG